MRRAPGGLALALALVVLAVVAAVGCAPPDPGAVEDEPDLAGSEVEPEPPDLAVRPDAATCALRCGDGRCFARAFRCDGVRQCSDGADERNCPNACTGCLDRAGPCQPGTTTAACGKNGAVCVTCAVGRECQDGQCLAPPPCGPATCPSGCCDARGTCVDGKQTTACGRAGEQCGACDLQGTCQIVADGGRCTLPCSRTCPGCCQPDGTCVPGQDDPRACGFNGFECVECAAGMTCNFGSCIGGTCAQTCSGCCAPDGTCTRGSSDAAACGKGGVACRACPGGGTCNEGICIPAGATCDGCWAGDGTCQPGTVRTACGQKGHACVDCGAMLECVDASDADSGDTELYRGCTLPRGRRWDLLLLNASLPSKTQTGFAWDPFGGLPDPRVTVSACVDLECNQPMTAASRVLDDTLTPNWNGDVIFSAIRSEDLLEVIMRTVDVDAVSNDFMDVCYDALVAHHRASGVRALESLLAGNPQECVGFLGVSVRWKLVPH